jgi:hypothetical protein
MTKPKTKRTKAPKKRPLATIFRELRAALKRGIVANIDAGKLLLEAQEQLEHGKFLSRIESEFRLSKSTAYDYMNAAKFARKSPNFGNLRKSALYLLGGVDDDSDVFTPEVIATILAEAKEKWVNEDRCWEIAEPLADKPPWGRDAGRQAACGRAVGRG